MEGKQIGKRTLKGREVKKIGWKKMLCIKMSEKQFEGGKRKDLSLLLFQNACSLFSNGTQVNLNWGDVYAGMC